MPGVGDGPEHQQPEHRQGNRRRECDDGRSGPAWSGEFHALLVTVPEAARAFRDEFRRAAGIAGYRTLRAGLLIAPTARHDELGDLLDRTPAGASVVPAWLRLDQGDARRVVQQLWDLDDLAARYRTVTAAATAAAETARSARTSHGDTLRAFAAATLPIYQTVADDPGLPPELLPPDWPTQQVGQALNRALAAFGPAVATHIAQLRQRSEHARPSPR